MDLGPHVDTLSRALAAARTAGSERAEVFAEAFVVPFESAIRLAMLNVLSAAADEISDDLAPGSVEVRLRGGDPAFVVNVPQAGDVVLSAVEAAPPPPEPLALPSADDGATSRISLRLPERLKARVDDVAEREGLSVNAWLGRVVAAAVEHEERQGGSGRRGLQIGQKHTGWIR
jgi:hypothetical protein